MSIIIQGPLGFKDKNGHPDIQPLQSFFETPQFTKDYTEAGNIAKNYPSTGGTPYEKQGLTSDVRHTLGASVGKDAIIDWASQFGFDTSGKLADVIGNVGITAATAAHEIPDAWNIGKQAFKRGDYGAITSGDFLTQPWEDVKANLNVWDIPYGSTVEEKLKQIPTLQAYMQKKATEQGIAQAAMQKKIQQAQTTSGGGGGGTPPGGRWQPDYSGAVAHQQQEAAKAGQTHEQFMSDLNEVRAKGGRVGYLDGGLAYLLYGGLV